MSPLWLLLLFPAAWLGYFLRDVVSLFKLAFSTVKDEEEVYDPEKQLGY